MLSRIILAAQLFICACSGHGITFEHDDVYVKLRGVGHVTMGNTEEPNELHGLESFKSRMSLNFQQLRISTPSNYELFKTGNERFHLHSNGFWRFRDMNVEGMSMTMNLSALGIIFNIKAVILKEDGQFQYGDHSVTELRRGEIIVSLQLSPSRDDDTDCIACQIDEGHVIQVAFDVTHIGSAEISDVLTRRVSAFRPLEYTDDAAVYIPKKIFVDGSTRRADLNITSESDNRHNIIVFLPAPLGESLEVDLIFKVQNPQPQTTLQPQPEEDSHKSARRGSADDMSRDAEERSRADANNADVEPERRIIEVQYTTMKASSGKERDANVIAAVQEEKQYNQSPTEHSISTLLMLLTALLCLLWTEQ